MSTTKRKEEKPITIGSCTAYIAEYTGTVPDHKELCVAANRLAYSKGGATITYSKETQEVQDDLGLIRKTITTSDSAKV